jgi:hypothetical protein
MNFRFLGPRARPTPFEFCACGMAYTTYWAHRETKQHKDKLREWRKESREQRAA